MIPQARALDDTVRPHHVLLINGPIHYDFLLPVDKQTKQTFAPLVPSHPELTDPGAEWLLVGWRAHGFYTTVGSYRDLSLNAIWRGVTGDSSVMRVDVLGALPPDLPVRTLPLSDQEYAALLVAIRNSFADTSPLPQKGFGDTDAFYPAIGRFNILRTCNVWISEMLRSAGLRFGVWTPLPVSVSVPHWLYGPALPD